MQEHHSGAPLGTLEGRLTPSGGIIVCLAGRTDNGGPVTELTFELVDVERSVTTLDAVGLDDKDRATLQAVLAAPPKRQRMEAP
jgi:hypothetical protein